MKASNLNANELAKDIRRIEKNLKQRVAHIEAHEDLPQFGAESFRKFEDRLHRKLDGRPLSSLTEEELRTLHRDIRYINDLKSTSIRGAEIARDKYIPVKEKLDVLSPEIKSKFWEIYGKLVDENRLLEQFKYDIMGADISMIYGGTQADEIVETIRELYDTTLEELGRNATDEDIKVLFTSKLESFLK